LIAYLVLEPGTEPSRREIREFLHQRLPRYEIPARFVEVERFPRTVGGKLDRGRLERADLGRELDDRSAESARAAIERLLTEIWQEVLEVEVASADENFFELGGNSLLLIEIAGRARQAGLELDAGLLLRHQTVAELARALERGGDR
jgi:hypothetical protein